MMNKDGALYFPGIRTTEVVVTLSAKKSYSPGRAAGGMPSKKD
jgi:hypothetical protein